MSLIYEHGLVKILLFIFFATATIQLLRHVYVKVQLRKKVLFTTAAAISFVTIYQTIGFMFYPGLVKDISLFSVKHLHISMIVFLIMLAYYVLCFVSLSLLRRKNWDAFIYPR